MVSRRKKKKKKKTLVSIVLVGILALERDGDARDECRRLFTSGRVECSTERQTEGDRDCADENDRGHQGVAILEAVYVYVTQI